MNENGEMKDKFGRIHNYLRLSLTDRCNLRCSYCMPVDPVFLPRKSVLQPNEILLLAKRFVELGVNKIRLTGGEPLVRKDFPEIVNGLSKLPVTLHLTTNGYYIDQYIDLIRETMRSVNVSLDTLRPERFQAITQRNAFARTLNNIDRLLAVNIPTKINVVVVRDVNDDEIPDFVNLTRHFPLDIRFIEFMPFQGNRWNLSQTFKQAEILERISQTHTIAPLEAKPNETSRNYRIDHHEGRFGIISTVSDPFCGDCNRIRITADGKLKNCLFSERETDLRSLIDSPERFHAAVRQSIQKKAYSYGGKIPMQNKLSESEYNQNRTMTAIGG